MVFPISLLEVGSRQQIPAELGSQDKEDSITQGMEDCSKTRDQEELRDQDGAEVIPWRMDNAMEDGGVRIT